MTTPQTDRRPMTVDLEGRVHNMPLPTSRPLLPLFEAIVNSIQAFPEERARQGRITVRLFREDELVSESAPTAPFTGFEVTDNGEGFSESNFESFCRSDSRAKASVGGKGIGRMLWLKAFDRSEVTSIYEAADGLRCRRFSFSIADSGVKVLEDGPAPVGAQCGTTVRLLGFKDPYRSTCPKKLGVVAAKILEHCILFFLHTDFPPHVEVFDSDGESVALNGMVESDYADRIERDELEIKGHKFRAIHLKMTGAQTSTHRIYYFGNKREVLHESLSKLIPQLRGALNDGARDFFWSTFVFGDYFDKHVDQERCAFTFPKDRDSDLDLADLSDGVALSEIREKVVDSASKQLDSLLSPVKLRNRERVKRYVEHYGYEYRIVLEYAPHIADSIPFDASDAEVDAALHRARFEIDLRAREEFRKLNEGSDDSEELHEQEERLLRTINEMGKGELAKYVIHRKAVLETLQRRLAKRDEGNYSYESEVHRLICPMRTDSLQVPADEHNLWVIDERLPYHRYLASDRPLSGERSDQMRFRGGGDAKAPDLFAAFTSLVFNDTKDDDAERYSSLLIVEFKRPQRDGYTRDKNPVAQVSEYVWEIRHGNAKDAYGRPIVVTDETRIDAYIICDITESLRKFLQMEGLLPTWDGTSYRGLNNGLRYAVEVISYTSLLSAARKRNRAFFTKLGIPDT